MKKRVFISWLFTPLLCFAGTLSQIEEDAVRKIVCNISSQSSEELLTQTDARFTPALLSLLEPPPFKLLSFVKSDEELCRKFNDILEDPVKGALILRAFSFRMIRDAMSEDFESDLDEFCTSFEINKELLKMFVEKNDWANFLIYSLKAGVEL